MSDPYLIQRTPAADALVVFIHGFTGTAVETWGKFPEFLKADQDLQKIDFLFWGYPSSINFFYSVSRYFWTDNPDIATVGKALRSLLADRAVSYKKLILVGHSMGGLAIQSFVLEELIKKERTHLDRLTEIVLYGTPSGGLKKAGWGLNFFNGQVDNMSASGEFIGDLRRLWKLYVDETRGRTDRLSRFKLTLVAGMKDDFVPQDSSLDPFPLDEKMIVPGNHIEMVKPNSTLDLAYTMLKTRLRRGTPTAHEQQNVTGESPETLARVSRTRAAADLGDVDDMLAQATEALHENQCLYPLAERALGMALLDYEQYKPAAELLTRYVDFVDSSDATPFAADAQAVQQLAIALSGAGDFLAAVERLKALDPQVANDPESQGILAGRFKRQWLRNPEAIQIGWRAFNLYKTAFEMARKQNNLDQIVYNGINAAFLKFALDKDARLDSLAREVIRASESKSPPDYWSEASRAEALLLLRDYPGAEAAYLAAQSHAPAPRQWATTGQQALEILRRQGQPPEGGKIAELFASAQRDF
jgi:pimeloyl-ACP methyl ester carboxylesterase